MRFVEAQRPMQDAVEQIYSRWGQKPGRDAEKILNHEGGMLIDLPATIRAGIKPTGLGGWHFPSRIAVAPIGATEVYCYAHWASHEHGFTDRRPRAGPIKWGPRSSSWIYETVPGVWPYFQQMSDVCRTSVALAPKDVSRSGGSLILFEVENWEQLRPANDPAIIRQVAGDIFEVLAMWDLSPLERAVLQNGTFSQ